MPKKFLKDHPPVMVHPPVLAGAAVALGLVLEWLIPTSVLSAPLNYWIGVPLILLSALLVGAPTVQFLKAKTGVATFQPATTLVTSGVYGLSRNPIYIGLVAGLLGLALVIDSLWLLLLVPVVALVLDRGVILREETYLEEKFGADYRDYKRRVRRWL